MRIDDVGSQTRLVGSGPRKASRDGAESAGAASALNAAETFQPTADVQGLLLALRQTPLIRPEVVDEVAARLRAGELATPKAKDETVQAVLETTLADA